MKTINKDAELLLSYEFSAPKKHVFNAFADAEALNEWWGPVECRNTVLKLDFRPGGVFHFKMEKDGATNYGRFIFGRIEPHDLLEFSNAFSDEKGNPVRAPFDITLPLEIFYSLRFTEKNGKTIITLTGRPVDPSPEELQGFISIHEGMQQGFGATFAKLTEYLGKM
jgi:uncharacterized protein YndB with AHSA1/START domain